MDFDEILDGIYLIPPASKQALKEHLHEVSLPKGHVIIHADTVEKSIYFIKSGIVRAYSERGDNQVTFWFGKEGDTVISMKSFVADEKGYESIELLEDCELYRMEVESIRKLYYQDIHIANWGRKFAEVELLKVEERLISRQFRTALERYNEIITMYPHLIQRVQLGHIASYLGITQASLSRIRAEIK
ncbi:Crp/Fnr family transcriptional regulator [Flavobacterium psychrotrophum]|uniref:Crp/Fnr family transcriptional regulator n=1 Tax=Flavobacterium psychrotrophum TaxID=2294119 RepID=UPI000E3132B5|nr:Crp/Fnr family transcriptional regulator [Flavobacterium psychrotrophum]